MPVGAKPITILHYEDKPEYAESFKARAQAQRIIVKKVDNVEDLLAQLNDNPTKYKYVVLDARAFRYEGQAAGTESETYLTKVFVEIERIRKAHDVLLPCCINTGFADLKMKLADTVECPIYDKGDEEKLFADIWDSYNNSQDAILRVHYPEVFDIADSYFDGAAIALLAMLLTNEKYQSTSIGDRVDNLARLRRTMEHLMDKLHSEYLGGAAGIVHSPATRAKDILHYLRGVEHVPIHIFGFAINLLSTASNYGSHNPAEAAAIADYPSGNALKSLTEGMFEVFAWAKVKLPPRI